HFGVRQPNPADADAPAGFEADADAPAGVHARADAGVVADTDAVTDTDASPRWPRAVGTQAGTRVRVTESGALAENARESYRASIAAGDPLTGRKLGRMYNRSPSWGRQRIGEVKAHDQGRAGNRRGSRPTRDAIAQQPVRSDGTGADHRMSAAAA